MSTELETKLKELNDELELLTSMVRAERLTATPANQQCTDEQAERMHKVLDRCISLASLPQQDVGAGRSVPSPVGQEQQPLFTEAQVKAMLKDILFHIADYGYVHDKFKEQSAKHGITLP